MTGAPPAEPRFPHLDAGTPHYESYFLKAHHPTEPRALWLRHTVHQRPGEPVTASVWLTLFDASAATPVRAGKVTVGADELAAPDGVYARIGDCEVGPGHARGRMETAGLGISWDLAIETQDEELRLLPADWMYEAKLPRTKTVTPHPAAVINGRLGGELLNGWVGLLSHNWGSEHAERWIWMHCGQFAGRGRDTWIELVLGRLRIGRWTVPWVASGALSLEGGRRHLGGPARLRGTRVDETPTGARFVVTGDGVRVEGEIRARPEDMVVWRYADPVGPEHHSAHSSIADLRLEVRGDDGGTVVLEAPQAASYELGMRETDHGLAVRPDPDGRL